jgi:hypothetical protein
VARIVTVAGTRITGNFAPGNLTGGGAYCADVITGCHLPNCVFFRQHRQRRAGHLRGVEIVVRAGVAPHERHGGQTARSHRIGFPPHPGRPPAAPVHRRGYLRQFVHRLKTTAPALKIVEPVQRDPVEYSDIQGGYAGDGNINEDPLFTDAWNEDYHLQSQVGHYSPGSSIWLTAGGHSPCIDTGDPSEPVGEEPPPNGDRINMGAYGGTRQASKGREHFVYHVDGTSGSDAYGGVQPDLCLPNHKAGRRSGQEW